jgi:hypothetical protein
MKVATSLLIAAAVVAPVVANGFEAQDSLVTREDNEFEGSFARDFDLELEEREFGDDLFEREPRGGKFLKKAFSFGRKAGSAYSPPQSPSETREFTDDLFERARGGGRGFSRKAGGGGGSRGRMMRTGGRGFKKALGRVSSAGSPSPETPSEAREFDEELYERAGGHGGGNGADQPSGSGSGGSGGHRGREFTEELVEREIEDDELFGRDVDLELFEREPEPFLFFNHIKKWWNNRKAKKNAKAATEDAAPETRSFDDEMELLEREYYDELD